MPYSATGGLVFCGVAGVAYLRTEVTGAATGMRPAKDRETTDVACRESMIAAVLTGILALWSLERSVVSVKLRSLTRG